MTIETIIIIVGVVLLILLKMFCTDKRNADLDKGFHGIEHDDVFKEEPEFDRTWSFLPGNIFNRSNDD